MYRFYTSKLFPRLIALLQPFQDQFTRECVIWTWQRGRQCHNQTRHDTIHTAGWSGLPPQSLTLQLGPAVQISQNFSNLISVLFIKHPWLDMFSHDVPVVSADLDCTRTKQALGRRTSAVPPGCYPSHHAHLTITTHQPLFIYHCLKPSFLRRPQIKAVEPIPVHEQHPQMTCSPHWKHSL